MALLRGDIRRPKLDASITVCPHTSVTGECCSEPRSRNFWKHLTTSHANCSPDCRGCSLVTESTQVRSVLPVTFPPWHGIIAQPAREIDYASLFLPERESYLEIPQQQQNMYHEVFKVLVGITYRTDDLSTVMRDFVAYCKFTNLSSDEPEKTPLELLGLWKSIKVSERKAKLTVQFVSPFTHWTDVKEKEKELLESAKIQFLPTSNPQRPICIVPLPIVLEELFTAKERRHAAAQLAPPSTMLLKITIDAGRIYSGKGSDAQLTIGSVEDVDRGKQEHRSRKSAHLFFAQSGKNLFFL